MRDITMGIEASDTGQAQEHWRRLRDLSDQKSRAWLIVNYLPFARMLAASQYKRRVNNSVAFDDFLQYARLGLLEAIDCFDPYQGVMFERYAVRRIRGAIFDGLGTESELAAQYKARASRLVTDRLESLNFSVAPGNERELLDQWVHTVVVLAFGVLLEPEEEGLADDDLYSNPYARLELLHLRRNLIKCVDHLPTREAEIIRLHYYEHLEFQLIATMLHLTKGRVSQLHAKALTRLRGLMSRNELLDTTL